MEPYRYFLPTQSLWANFDSGIVHADNEEEALVKAKERLTYDFEKANDVLNSADVTTGFNLEFDANQITVALLNGI